jgi:Zn-dependent M28 family amino/carboxypeptidase
MMILNITLGFALALLLQGVLPTSSLFDAGKTLKDVEILSADDMAGRRTGTPGIVKARDYIVGRFQEAGIKPFGASYLQTFSGGVNVVGWIEGARRTGRYIVVTAHYDHIGTRNGSIFNGADDNASGVAGMIAAASYFSKNPPQNSLIFAALDAEETTGAGGRALVNNPPIEKSAIVMNVNLDMIAREFDNRLFAVGTYHYPYLATYVDKVASQAKVQLLKGHDRPDQRRVDNWTEDSDHIWFHRAKIPFIYFGVEDYEQHHKTTDDFETITPVFFIHAVETIVEALKVFDANLADIEKNKSSNARP